MSLKTVTRDDESTVNGVSTQDLFASLEGKTFGSYRDFNQAVEDALGRYRSAFPLAYTPRQAIAWAYKNGWIVASDKGLQIKMR